LKVSKLIKAFTPFTSTAALFDWCGRAARNPDKTAPVIELFIARDPGESEWTNLGLIEPLEKGSYVHDLDGTARVLKFQFSERKLPASVRDEEVNKRYRELTEKEGRALNKKEFAQLREDVEISLLPKAFITRKIVPVLVFKDRVLVCSSSATQVERVLVQMARLADARKVDWQFGEIPTGSTPGYLLGQIAREGLVYTDDEDSTKLEAGEAAVFKGEDKRAIRVKDRDLASEEIQKISTSGSYSATELALRLRVIDEETAAFTLTDKLVFKAIKLSDITVSGIGDDVDDLHATYWLYATTLNTILANVLYALQADADETSDDDDL
jgi:recombination associated protein RdgC